MAVFGLCLPSDNVPCASIAENDEETASEDALRRTTPHPDLTHEKPSTRKRLCTSSVRQRLSPCSVLKGIRNEKMAHSKRQVSTPPPHVSNSNGASCKIKSGPEMLGSFSSHSYSSAIDTMVGCRRATPHHRSNAENATQTADFVPLLFDILVEFRDGVIQLRC